MLSGWAVFPSQGEPFSLETWLIRHKFLQQFGLVDEELFYFLASFFYQAENVDKSIRETGHLFNEFLLIK